MNKLKKWLPSNREFSEYRISGWAWICTMLGWGIFATGLCFLGIHFSPEFKAGNLWGYVAISIIGLALIILAGEKTKEIEK